MAEQPADVIDTRARVLTRQRLEQLREVGLFPGGQTRRLFTYWGPLAPLDRLLDESEPPCSGHVWRDGDELSTWGSVMVYVEPEWKVRETALHTWVAYADWGGPYDGSDLNPHWQSEELANRYLDLLTDNFWAEVA